MVLRAVGPVLLTLPLKPKVVGCTLFKDSSNVNGVLNVDVESNSQIESLKY